MINIEYCVPSKFKKAKSGTIIKVMQEKETFDFYIQVSRDEENPIWINLAGFLEEALGGLIEDESFINSCLSLYYDQANETAAKNIQDTLIRS